MSDKTMFQGVDSKGRIQTYIRRNGKNEAITTSNKLMKFDVQSLTRSFMDLDLVQNIGFRNIHCTFERSTTLGHMAYYSGRLGFFRNTNGYITYAKITPLTRKDNGRPHTVKLVPIFTAGSNDSIVTNIDTEAYSKIYTVDEDIVLWYDALGVDITTDSSTARVTTNLPYIDMMSTVCHKLIKQLKLSGNRLIVKTLDQSSVQPISTLIQNIIDDEDIVQALANGIDVDTNILSITPQIEVYLRALQDINQLRQYLNGQGTGSFGTVKNREMTQSEMYTNMVNTNVVFATRVMLDNEWLADMDRVFGEKIIIEYLQGNNIIGLEN